MKKLDKLTSIGAKHNRRPTHRTISLISFLHFDKTPNAEQVPTTQPYGFERNSGADETGVVVQVGYDGYQGFADRLDEHSW